MDRQTDEITRIAVEEDTFLLTGVFPPPTDFDSLADVATSALEMALPQGPVARSFKRAQLLVGLIDGYRLSQECLVRALTGASAFVNIAPFDTVADCMAYSGRKLDLLIYYSHATSSWDATVQRDITLLQQVTGRPPLIVMSEIDEAHQSAALRCAMGCGARGFIPSRTTDMPITLAVIDFVWAGGVYAPLDLLLWPPGTEKCEPEMVEMRSKPRIELAIQNETVRNRRFTVRQRQVLTLLRQGKANKAIAFELGMSESTVKVHVRNIMRVTGASNRTEAAYNGMGWDDSVHSI